MTAIATPQQLSTACSSAEWETRLEQAALYRLLDHYGMSDLANQVVGARVKDSPDQYLLHQYGGHCEDVMAVGSTKQGLRAVSQAAVYLMHLATYIDYEFFEDEVYGEKFKRTLGDKEIMITRNHGYHVLGRSAAEAFFRTHYLRQACSVQVKVLSMKDEPRVIDPQTVARLQDQMYESPHYSYDGRTEWAALLRKLDCDQPDNKT